MVRERYTIRTTRLPSGNFIVDSYPRTLHVHDELLDRHDLVNVFYDDVTGALTIAALNGTGHYRRTGRLEERLATVFELVDAGVLVRE